MHPDLKHFYQTVLDCNIIGLDYFKTMSYRKMLDTHPNCEELLGEYAELAVRIYLGEANLPLAARMSEIEKTLDSCRLPF